MNGIAFNTKPEAMAESGMDRLHVTLALASGFGSNEEVVSLAILRLRDTFTKESLDQRNDFLVGILNDVVPGIL